MKRPERREMELLPAVGITVLLGLGFRRLTWDRHIGIQPVQPPGVSVSVQKSMSVNEAQILRGIISGATCSNCFGNDGIDLLPALAVQTEHNTLSRMMGLKSA